MNELFVTDPLPEMSHFPIRYSKALTVAILIWILLNLLQENESHGEAHEIENSKKAPTVPLIIRKVPKSVVHI